MVQLVDIFAKPMMCLLSAVIQWFVDNQINYMPQSIFTDVSVSRYRCSVRQVTTDG